MPLLDNAKKALRVSKRKNVVNNKIRSKLKTVLDKVRKTPTPSLLAEAFSVLDRATKKNILHANKASRIKSQLSKLDLVKEETPKKSASKTTKAKTTKAKKTTTAPEKKASPKKTAKKA